MVTALTWPGRLDTHLDGLRYEVWDLFQSGITGRVSEEVLEWNCQSALVLRPQRTCRYCKGFLHIFICTGKLHNICWTILRWQKSAHMYLQIFSDLVCLSLLNLFPNNLHIFLVGGTFPGTPFSHHLSLSSFSFTFLANCRRSSRCSWTQRRLAATPRAPRRQCYHREPACAPTRRRGRPAKK